MSARIAVPATAAVLIGAGLLLMVPVLAIGAVTVPPVTPPPAMCGPGTRLAGQELTGTQLANAATITSATAHFHDRGGLLPPRAAVIALATAYTESALYNLGYGDADSLGLFQQRVSIYGRGVAADPAAATRAFLTHLVDLPRWRQLPIWVAAADIQRPQAELRHRYAAAVPLARALTARLWPPDPRRDRDRGATGDSRTRPASSRSMPAAVRCRRYTGPATGTIAAVIDAGYRWLGTPYAWGGGTLAGPSEGTAQGSGIVGFDCSSLVRYMIYQGTDHAVVLPRTSAAQYAATAAHTITTRPDPARLRPGDLLFWGTSPATIHHVAVYIGNNQLIEAPHTGAVVGVTRLYRKDFYAATRLPLNDPPQAVPARVTRSTGTTHRPGVHPALAAVDGP